MLYQQPYGVLPTGENITEYTLVNEHGMQITVINYGCTITSIKIPDEAGNTVDVVLGFDSLEGYLQSTQNIGCIIGRCAGRIAYGHLVVEGRHYTLPINHPPHHLHGGHKGFDKVVWEAVPFETEDGQGIEFQYLSVDGDEGYPGNVQVRVRYFLSHQDTIILDYDAETDAPTVINLTQHTYFNLNGGKETILKHALQIPANYYLPVDEWTIPTGEFEPVQDTPFDFRTPRLIGSTFLNPHPQILLTNGIDHCWVLDSVPGKQTHAASLLELSSKLKLDVYTTVPGVQVYTGNFLTGKGKNDISYGAYSGICLETQHFPDAPHHPHFPDILILPGEKYTATTVWQWSRGLF